MPERPTSGTGSGLWPTPQTSEAKSDTLNVENRIEKGKQIMLCHAVRMWATPQSRDYKGAPGEGARANGGFQSSLPADVGANLSPDWVEWLMGWPVGWTDVGARVTDGALSWDTDPADAGDVPRVAAGVKHRVSRLKAIGNGQAPACAALAWEILSNE